MSVLTKYFVWKAQFEATFETKFEEHNSIISCLGDRFLVHTKKGFCLDEKSKMFEMTEEILQQLLIRKKSPFVARWHFYRL